MNRGMVQTMSGIFFPDDVNGRKVIVKREKFIINVFAFSCLLFDTKRTSVRSCFHFFFFSLFFSVRIIKFIAEGFGAGMLEGVEKRDIAGFTKAGRAIISNQSQSLRASHFHCAFSFNDFNPRLALNIHLNREGTKPMRRVEDVKKRQGAQDTRVWV